MNKFRSDCYSQTAWSEHLQRACGMLLVTSDEPTDSEKDVKCLRLIHLQELQRMPCLDCNDRRDTMEEVTESFNTSYTEYEAV